MPIKDDQQLATKGFVRKQISGLNQSLRAEMQHMESRLADCMVDMAKDFDGKLFGLEERIDGKLFGLEERINEKMDSVISEFHIIAEKMHHDFNGAFHDQYQMHDDKIQSCERRIRLLETRQ